MQNVTLYDPMTIVSKSQVNRRAGMLSDASRFANSLRETVFQIHYT